MGAYAAPPILPPRASGLRSALSILWTIAIVGFFLLIALNVVGLLLSPASVVPGIQGIAPGQNANQDLAVGSANWTFEALGPSSVTGSYAPSGGNPGGALQMTIPAGASLGGAWVEAVQLSGSAPFVGEVHLDYWLQTSAAVTGRLIVSVESTPTGLNLAQAANETWINTTAASVVPWTSTPRIDVSGAINASGTYYLKIAYLVASGAGTTEVRFDNIHMGWTTDAEFYFYLPLPLPELLYLLYISQDPAQFLAYYVFIVVAILAAAAWYTWRDRRLTVKAITAPLAAIGPRLRSMSGWVAVAQVWCATMFFQYALILILAAVGTPPTSPFTQTSTNAWVLLFDYSAASVFEEIAFRAVLIGVPMAVASLIVRAVRARRAPPAGPGAGRLSSVLGGLRYLWGGHLRKESPKEAQLAAWILILVSSLLFGLAHAPGWGWWKVVPAFVVGLGMGYVFVRHGLGASILLHFATDGSLALSLEGPSVFGLAVVSDLLFLGLAIAGSGFFAWYVLYGWEEFRDLRARFGSRIIRQPAGTVAVPAAPPPPNAGVAYPLPRTGYAPSGPGWTQPPPVSAVPRNPNQIPQGYAPTYHPAPYGYPPVRFQCPSCGWVEAKYENRRFTCLRCGRTA